MKGHIKIPQNLYVPFKDTLNLSHSQDLGLQWKAKFFKMFLPKLSEIWENINFFINLLIQSLSRYYYYVLIWFFHCLSLCLYFIELCFITFSLLFFIINNIIFYFINTFYWRTLRTLWLRSTWSKNQLFYSLIQ